VASSLANITIDCADPEVLAEFWAAALGYVKQSAPEAGGDCTAVANPCGRRPRLLFRKVSELKVVKNRVHLDLAAENMDAEVDRLVARGARKLRTCHEQVRTWTMMTDPEGNEFCILG
jgi:predicted enzyme related to lactoylglutathione lyase